MGCMLPPAEPQSQDSTEEGDIWAGRIDDRYRYTFQIEDDVLVMRTVGPHKSDRKP